jgi:hypothetical protein
MPYIKLTRRKLAVVDFFVMPQLHKYGWIASPHKKIWYAMTTENDKTVYMHRKIMELHLGRPLNPNEEIDHIDGDGLNNEIANLRLATHHQNTMNHGKHTQNTKYLGVRFEDRYKNPWRAGIMVDAKFIQLGNFATEEEAAIQRDLGSIKFFGEYAKLNFPDRREEFISKIRSGFDPVSRPKFSSNQFVGVTKKENSWQAFYHKRVNGVDKITCIGTYATEEEAARMRAKALGGEIQYRKQKS